MGGREEDGESGREGGREEGKKTGRVGKRGRRKGELEAHKPFVWLWQGSRVEIIVVTVTY